MTYVFVFFLYVFASKVLFLHLCLLPSTFFVGTVFASKYFFVGIVFASKCFLCASKGGSVCLY